MASGTAASVKLYATGLQRPRVLTVKIELMSACGPIGEVAARLIEVGLVERSGLELLTLSSSHFDPSPTSVADGI
jgi:hypothetical protein